MCDYGEKAAQAQTETLGLRAAFDRQHGQMAMRANLKEQILSRAQRAEQQANESRRLQRLMELGDKHPEVLEMLDLLRGLDLS